MKLAGKTGKVKIFGFHFSVLLFRLVGKWPVLWPLFILPKIACFSCDFASDDIVFIMQSSNMATRMPEMANDFEMSSNSVL